MPPSTAEYGFWKSPITSDLIVAESIRLGGVSAHGQDIYWLEGRPAEKGRNVLVRRTPDGRTEDLTPEPFNVRTRAHEYGGGSYLVSADAVYFSNYRDQRLYQVNTGTAAAITPEANWRYADGVVSPDGHRLISVREDHTQVGREAVNTIVSIDLSGDRGQRVLVEGADFYSNPRLSPDGSKLSWLQWRHPNMPWDGTELWVAELSPDGALGERSLVAGGTAESVFQPQWAPDGRLCFVSDPGGWWNLFAWDGDGARPVVEKESEFGLPQWVFGMSTYAISDAGEAYCAYCERGAWKLARVGLADGTFVEIEVPYSDISDVAVAGNKVVFRGGSPTEPAGVVLLDPETGEHETLKRSVEIPAELRRYISVPETIEAPSSDGRSTHAFFYPAHNPDHLAPDGEEPPLLVISHGGPTGATSSVLSLSIQYWTSRGFGVVDVNYGGSTGYGRAYREQLAGTWGIVDVEDCSNVALHLADQGRADRARLIIRGGSAGGYTTLAALAFGDSFRCGASYYGVSDLEALAKETHKFESRYLDKLVGPYPERRDLYLERSPIHSVDTLAAPVIFFQGAEDKVVPPNQAERMVEALRAKGLPVGYLLFDGEQHGFRGADNIKRALDAELYFYASILLKKGLRF